MSSIKTTIEVFNGSLSSGLSSFTLPTMQGYGSGVLMVKVYGKSGDGVVSAAFTEFMRETDGDGLLVAENSTTAGANEWEWRLEVPLPAIYYRVEMFSQASTASADIVFIAS